MNSVLEVRVSQDSISPSSTVSIDADTVVSVNGLGAVTSAATATLRIETSSTTAATKRGQ